MGIYFRDILIIRISRGTNNCSHCVLEKNYLFYNVISSHFQIIFFTFLNKILNGLTMRIYFYILFDHIYQGY